MQHLPKSGGSASENECGRPKLCTIQENRQFSYYSLCVQSKCTPQQYLGTVNTAATREEVQFHHDLATIQWIESAHLKNITRREPREDQGQVLNTDLDADWLHVS